jgi:hypothetical protein
MPKLKGSAYDLFKGLPQREQKGIARLIDPYKLGTNNRFLEQFDWIKYADRDFIFTGGSHLR